MNSKHLISTFLPDYAGPGRRVLWEQGPEATKHYLYGQACLGEQVTDNATAATEWRYYLRDGSGLVRQTADETAAITLAWTFSPDGGVVLGEEGPVTHLGCDDNAVYDWSTGLIFKNGRYFDPRLGLWLLAPFMIVFRLWRPRRRRNGRKRSPPDRFYTMLLLLLVVALPLAGCDGQQTPTPTPTCTPTPTPGLPGDTPNPPAPTPGNPSTPTPGQPTPTPGPPDTPTPQPPTPTRGIPREHWGNDRTIVLGYHLSEDDLLLLDLGVFAENHNASDPPWAMELWTWVFLNKLARNPGPGVYSTINSSSGAWNDPDFIRAHKPFRGNPPSDPVSHRTWLLDTANFYKDGPTQNSKNFQALFKQIAGEDPQAFDGGVYDEWRRHGTNSSADPTHGAIFAVHRSADRFENELGPLFANYAQVNPRFSYVFSEPYSGIMTVVGNTTCVYDHSLCQ